MHVILLGYSLVLKWEMTKTGPARKQFSNLLFHLLEVKDMLLLLLINDDPYFQPIYIYGTRPGRILFIMTTFLGLSILPFITEKSVFFHDRFSLPAIFLAFSAQLNTPAAGRGRED
jgi:hypothetical protein